MSEVELKPFRIYIPVVCQNGHKATASFRLENLDFIFESVPRSEQCRCPKMDSGQGYRADGKPFTHPPLPGGEVTCNHPDDCDYPDCGTRNDGGVKCSGEYSPSKY